MCPHGYPQHADCTHHGTTFSVRVSSFGWAPFWKGDLRTMIGGCSFVIEAPYQQSRATTPRYLLMVVRPNGLVWSICGPVRIYALCGRNCVSACNARFLLLFVCFCCFSRVSDTLFLDSAIGRWGVGEAGWQKIMPGRPGRQTCGLTVVVPFLRPYQ